MQMGAREAMPSIEVVKRQHAEDQQRTRAAALEAAIRALGPGQGHGAQEFVAMAKAFEEYLKLEDSRR